MREMREIAAANLDRRDLLKLGLVAGSSGVAALAGTRGFTPYWAHASNLQFASPPNRYPFSEPLPISAVMQPIALHPRPTKARNTSPSTYKSFGEAPRPDHQRWSRFGGSDTVPGFVGAQCESIEKAVSHDFYPKLNGYPPSTVWTSWNEAQDVRVRCESRLDTESQSSTESTTTFRWKTGASESTRRRRICTTVTRRQSQTAGRPNSTMRASSRTSTTQTFEPGSRRPTRRPR
jgi:hypothetical protein